MAKDSQEFQTQNPDGAMSHDRLQNQYLDDVMKSSPATLAARPTTELAYRTPATTDEPSPATGGTPAEARGRTIPCIPEGTFKIKNEAQIVTSKDGKLLLSRTGDDERSFQLTPTKDGGIKYEHHGIQPSDNYTYTITPDGKGGNNIQWKIAKNEDGTESIEGSYHWAPTGRSTERVPTLSGEPILDNGKGTSVGRLQLRDDVSYNIQTSDNQNNQVAIKEDGSLAIHSKNLGLYTFTPDKDGYYMRSSGQTEDGITAQGFNNGVSSVERRGVTVAQRPDGGKEIVKRNANGVISRWLTFENGTAVTTTEIQDHNIERWIIPPGYPKDSFMHEERTNPNTAKETIRLRDTEQARQLATGRIDDLEQNHNMMISRDSAVVSTRIPTLEETEVLRRASQKFPCDPQRPLKVYFFDGKNFKGAKEPDAIYSGAQKLIGINPSTSRVNCRQENIAYKNAGYDSLEAEIDHELAHDWIYRLDPKGYENGELENKLASVFGMHHIVDVTDHKEKWIVEGETIKGKPVNGITEKDTKLYYKPVSPNGKWIRCDLSGNPIDSSGKLITNNKKIVLINSLDNHAKVKLPTNYAYFSPLEAAPELLVSHGINEASRISFLQKTSPAARRWTEETDKKLVNAAKFHDKEQPLGGWVRIASGDIVPKAQGQSLVDIFNKKYAQKESKPS